MRLAPPKRRRRIRQFLGTISSLGSRFVGERNALGSPGNLGMAVIPNSGLGFSAISFRRLEMVVEVSAQLEDGPRRGDQGRLPTSRRNILGEVGPSAGRWPMLGRDCWDAESRPPLEAAGRAAI